MGWQTLCGSLSGAVPYPHYPRDISASNIETGGGESGYCSLGCVRCVLFADSGVIDGAEEDRLV